MPMIRVIVPRGLLDAGQRAAIAEDLSVAIMKVETGGEDMPGFRAISALVFDEVEPDRWAVGGKLDSGPSALVEVRVPKGALNDERRAAMAESAYDVLVRHSPALAEADGPRRVWTHLIEIEGWGAGGRIVSLADVVEIAADPQFQPA